MGILMRLLLIWAAILPAGELPGWERLRGRLVRSLEANPSEGNLGALVPQLESLPNGPRLELARRFAAARPDSDALTVALADAYGANGLRREALATLEAALRARPGNKNLPALAANCLARWKLYEEAAALLARSLEASSHPPQYLQWHLALVDYSRELADGGPAERLQREWQRRMAAGERDLKTHLLLAQALALSGDRTGLRRLCESALALFPEERRFYDHLARALETAGDLAGLEALRRAQSRSIPRPISSDYEQWARAFLLAGKPESARRALAEGLEDGRLSEAERRKLAQRSASLELLWDEIRSSAPAFEACIFEDAGPSLSVDCGGKRLSYDFAGKSFQTSEPPAEAARLAAALLERFGREEFAAADGEKAAVTDATLMLLKAAGYMGP